MSNFKLLVVEDDEKALQTYRDTIDVYIKKNSCQIDLKICKNTDEAIGILDSSFDGAIIDLKLGTDPDAGNKVIDSIFKQFRIPIAIMTGTPANADVHPYVTVCKKGVVGYDKVLDSLLEVHKTGITKILGGRGEIEKVMNRVFWENILPQLHIWKSYAKDGKPTERALLRFTLNHLMELLDEDCRNCFPEEMYITPPLYKGIKCGSIVKHKTNSKYFIVLSPSCDLVIRTNGDFKTDKILICEIDDFDTIKNNLLSGITNRDKKLNKTKELLKNNYTEYYHWLPKHQIFKGGFVNFRWAQTIDKNAVKTDFEEPTIQVSSAYVKDIQARFSIYYARQGQPDFDFDGLSNNIVG
jgi:hypothetical protein